MLPVSLSIPRILFKDLKWLPLHKNSVLGDIKLKTEERSWLEQTCPYFTKEYLDFLSSFRLNPSEQVITSFIPSESDENIGQIVIDIQGKWSETILYEVPLMAALSEAYFRTVDTDWTYDGQEGTDPS